MAKVLVLPRVKSNGWSGVKSDLRDPNPSNRPTYGIYCDIVDLFREQFTYDALVQPCLIRLEQGVMAYTKAPEQPRLSARARIPLEVEGHSIVFESIWIDVDHVPHAATPTDEWYARVLRIVADELPDNVAYYDTPHGMRLVWTLAPSLDMISYQSFATSFGKYLGERLNDENTKVDTCYSDATHGYYPPHCIRLDETVAHVPRYVSYENLGPLDWQAPSDFERGELGRLDDAARAIRKLGRRRFVLPDRILQGTRAETLFRYASALVARGFNEEFIATEIRKAYQERCDHDPPMYESEIERMAYTTYHKYSKVGATLATCEMPPTQLYVEDRRAAANTVSLPTVTVAAPVEATEPGAQTGSAAGGLDPASFFAAMQPGVGGAESADPVAAFAAELPPTVDATNAKHAVAHFRSDSGVYLADRMLGMLEGSGIDDYGDLAPGPPEKKLVFDRGNFYGYYPPAGCWQMIPEHLIIQLLATFDGRPMVTGLKDGTPTTKPLRLGAKSIKGDILPMAQAKRTEPNFFDQARHGVTFADCFVTIDGGNLVVEDKDRENRALYAFPHSYDPDANPERFVDFLNDLFRDDAAHERAQKVQLIREFLGAAILGIATRFESALFLVGNGRNGKSTLLTILQKVFELTGMGSGFVASLSPQAMADPTEVSMLTRAAINLVDDMPRDALMDTSNLKSVVSGKQIRGRERYQQAYTFTPRCAHIFNMNDPPFIRDNSDGFWRRAILIEFRRQIALDEVDYEIGPNIVKHELAAISSWFVSSVPTLLARGHFEMPESSTRAINSWRTSSDSALEFLASLVESDFVKDAARFVSANELYSKFSAWCATSNKKPYGPATALRHIAQSLKVPVHNDKGMKGIILPSREKLALLTGADQ